MVKRIGSFLLALALLLSFSISANACDEEQSNAYIQRLLFGDDTLRYQNDADVKKLMDALFLCSQQSNKDGQEKIDALNNAKVSGIPTIAKINISEDMLFECSHSSWDFVSSSIKTIQKNRKDVLRKTVVNVFDFGWFNEAFHSNQGQIDSLSALLYYTHILADYLADDPVDTEISAKGYDIPAYSGVAYYELNGNQPTFTATQKKERDTYANYSNLDQYKRCGAGITLIGPDTLDRVAARSDISNIKPSGWNQKTYEGVMASGQPLYNRCHLIAHSLGGHDTLYNLVTGTRYLNEAMEKYENQVAKYIKETGNHVLYRATPVYVADNQVASGVQLEALSLEDKGAGICFSVYFYNVQPGVGINYANGKSELVDDTIDANGIIPFVTDIPSANNPDLMFVIRTQLEILFINQKDSAEYKAMINDLDLIADEARTVGGDKSWKVYAELKQYQYDYMETLCEYVPKLLAKEAFFTSAFPAA